MLAQLEKSLIWGTRGIKMWSKVCIGYDLSGEPWGGLGQQGAWGPGHLAGGADILSSLTGIMLAGGL